MMKKHFVFVAGIIACWTQTFPATAQMDDIFRVYSTRPTDCDKDSPNRIVFKIDHISGPGFQCYISEFSPAGTGMMSADSDCKVNGNKISDSVSIDIGNYADHFEVAIPGIDAWMKMYRCE